MNEPGAKSRRAQPILVPPLLLHLQHLPVSVNLHVQSHLHVQQALIILQLAQHLAPHLQQLLILLMMLLLPNISLSVHRPLQILAVSLQHQFLTAETGP